MLITLEQVNIAYNNYENSDCIIVKNRLYIIYEQLLNEYYTQPRKKNSYELSCQNDNAYGLYKTGTGTINIGSTESFIGCHGYRLGIN